MCRVHWYRGVDERRGIDKITFQWSSTSVVVVVTAEEEEKGASSGFQGENPRDLSIQGAFLIRMTTPFRWAWLSWGCHALARKESIVLELSQLPSDFRARK